MLFYLHELKEQFQPFNVFYYPTFRAVGAALTAFLLSLMFGGKVITILRRLKLGQPIRTKEEVHKLAEKHAGKSGTPTMGGVLIIGAVVLSSVLWCRPTNPLVWLGVFTLLFLGGLGFMDDYAKVKKKNSKGISSRAKLLGQFILAALVTAFFLLWPEPPRSTDPHMVELYGQMGYTSMRDIMTSVYVPFFKGALLPALGIFIFLFFSGVLVGSSNAVNLTDGLDGLAIGCTITTASAFAVLNYLSGDARHSAYLLIPFSPYAADIGIMCSALTGAGLGFLWFNCYPARVFMGDTGSLAIGGFIGLAAITCKQEFLLVVIGGVFVAEALSVVAQVISFKTTGKRIFKMSPLHHHFELSGWKESTVIVRFWIISLLFALLGLATLKLR
jgi:phospho-N-acetylmuramoyl-pentapeptide-transferase